MDLNGSMNSGARVCAMRDDHRYPSKRGYSSQLYNLAWARAVQRKSMDNVAIKENTTLDERKKTSPSPPAHTFSSGNQDDSEIAAIVTGRVVDGGRGSKDDNCDEGGDDELEEGEIDSSSESETVEKLQRVEEKLCSDVNEGNVSDVENVLETMVKSVNKTLQEFTGSVSEKTFAEVCTKIEGILEGLSEMISPSDDDDAVGRTFSFIEKINSVFCSMNQNQKQQSQEVLSRLLICALSQTHSLFSTDQVKEMDIMMLSLADPSIFCNGDSSAMATEIEDRGGLSELDIEELYRNTNPDIKSSPVFDPPSFNHPENISQCLISDEPFSVSNSIRSFELLLDLQKDHDADTLPSPTRDSQSVGFIMPDSSSLPVTSHRVQTSATHPYETDALKAVCTYQQKFGKTSFSSSDLPSPTPSDDSNSEDDDALAVSSGRNTDFIQPMKSSPVEIMASTSKEDTNKNGFLVSDHKPVTRSQARSRDPRLRQIRSTTPVSGNGSRVASSSNSVGLRKQVPNEEICVIGPPMKRPRQALMDVENCESREEDKGVVVEKGVMDTTRGMDVQVPDEINDKGNMGLELSSILKDISVNPTLLIKLLKLDLISDKALSSPMGNDLSDAVTQDSGNEPGKINIKPRDPRRILQNGTMLKVGTPGSEQIETTVSSHTTPRNGTILSCGITPPDITKQFTNNLKNIADLISSTAVSTPVLPHIPSILPVQVSTDKIGKRPTILDAAEMNSAVVRTPDDVNIASLPSQHRCWEDMEHLLEGYDEQQKADIHKERARRMEEQKQMFAARKLCLVLDLDHTLLNSAKFFEVDPVHDEILRRKEEQDREKHRRHLFRIPHMGMWTKLRPGIWNFLMKASKLYELHLYTMGNKPYATEMAKVLDPKGVLFSGRVISRGDDGDVLDGDERAPKNKDLEGVLGMESAVVIIDDSVRVWPHNKLNLIVVERYTYFPCSRRQFGLPGPSLLEIDHDERPEEGTLASSLAVIERIHQIFFAQPSLDDVDVRNILGSEQKRILSGCRVVFSRIFPVGEANPHIHPLWQTAEQFGATCTNQIDEMVTHVVANSLGTDKVNWALATGRWVVHPGWVEASALLYRRASEKDFAVKS